MDNLWKKINDFKKYRLRTGEIKSGLEWKQSGYKWPQLLEEVS